jgi:hypothetical protein
VSGEEFARLISLLRLHVPDVVEEFLPRTLTPGSGRCLPATRIGLETLRYFGVGAEPLPTRAMAVNAAWQEWMHGDAKGEPPMPDEAWSVGVGWPVEGRGVNLHLIIAIDNGFGRYFLDLDSGQFSRPNRAMPVEPTLCLPFTEKERTGRMFRTAGVGLEGGGRIDYVEHPNPESWKQGLDWRHAKKQAGKVIRRIRAELG